MINDETFSKLYELSVNIDDGPFGCWISSLYSTTYGGIVPRLTIECQKEYFLLLLRRLLDEGKVYLSEPQDGACGSRDVLNASVWAAPHDEMIAHIRRHWPEGITHENDLRLTDFWYSNYCPRILWYDEASNRLIES